MTTSSPCVDMVQGELPPSADAEMSEMPMGVEPYTASSRRSSPWLVFQFRKSATMTSVTASSRRPSTACASYVPVKLVMPMSLTSDTTRSGLLTNQTTVMGTAMHTIHISG